MSSGDLAHPRERSGILLWVRHKGLPYVCPAQAGPLEKKARSLARDRSSKIMEASEVRAAAR